MCKHQTPLQTIYETSATLSKRNGVVVHIRDKGEYSSWEVCFDVGICYTLIDESTEKLFGIVECDMIFLIVSMYQRLYFTFKSGKSA
jgi:hypothetical protein